MSVDNAVSCPSVPTSRISEEAARIIDALGGPDSADDGPRRFARNGYQVTASLQMIDSIAPPRAQVIYTHDASEWGIGFVGEAELPVGREAAVSLPAPDGTIVTVRACVLRCTQVEPGWFVGGMVFGQRCPLLAPARME